jgi:hypothetical protein
MAALALMCPRHPPFQEYWHATVAYIVLMGNHVRGF